ncbi:MAG: ABC transporter permease [Bacteroidales bacterium]|nr:ABC transporter permease [Clostridium sp.]MCM1203921.1 ABC transporter permease [Bacteroidales bacterium]
MRTLIKFELLKLYKKKMNRIVFWGTCAMMVLFSLTNAMQNWVWDEEGNKLEGFSAIRYKREREEKLEGPLTDLRAKELILEFQEMCSNPDNLVKTEDDWNFVDSVYYSYYMQKRDLLTLIAHNYDAPWDNTWGGNLIKLTGEEEPLYEARTNRLKEMLCQGSSDWQYSKAEQDFWLEKNGKIEKPFVYGYAEGWEQVLDMMGFFTIPLISLFMMIAGTYAGEYESHAEHIILTTKYGKSKVIAAKNTAAFIFGGAFVLLTSLLMALIILLCNGFEGANLVIQNYNVDSPYPFTYIQAVFICMGVNVVMALGMTAVTLFLSARMKSGLPVLAAMMLIFFIALFLTTSMTNGTYNHILLLLPYNVAMSTELGYLESYRFGNLVLSCISMRYVTYTLITVLLLPFIGRAFKRHQVQ